MIEYVNGVSTYPSGRQVCEDIARGRAEYMARKMRMAMRQGWLCALCGAWMSRDEVTFDHEHGRGMGGAKRDDRIEVDGVWQNAAVHGKCNRDKGSRKVDYVVRQP